MRYISPSSIPTLLSLSSSPVSLLRLCRCFISNPPLPPASPLSLQVRVRSCASAALLSSCSGNILTHTASHAEIRRRTYVALRLCSRAREITSVRVCCFASPLPLLSLWFCLWEPCSLSASPPLPGPLASICHTSGLRSRQAPLDSLFSVLFCVVCVSPLLLFPHLSLLSLSVGVCVSLSFSCIRLRHFSCTPALPPLIPSALSPPLPPSRCFLV